MSSNFPITPPPELVNKWLWEFAINKSIKDIRQVDYVATRAARWASDQELEACCEEMKSIPSPLGIPFGEMASNALRAARRPKAPNLKAQALALINGCTDPHGDHLDDAALDTIRRALESLPD